ncbi:hypothetical protein jhhlp_003461 [Lomentospora prolificans]|uniref:RNA polymerase II subunit B1 CTD phosphatase RPAP2 homolog n=1 Tax=Lomentospora prolificans TaxID=41688 RepID=A0A2N3N8T5_9PEZI|nr:hypothetical protein jhhlp_003461 [Lomentospora prolificans]
MATAKDILESLSSGTETANAASLLNPGASRRSRRDPKEVALEHARILQQRKELETVILQNIITLSEYPRIRTSPYSAANPSPSDVADFKKLVRLFQPSDYDDLIAERNANDLCGYVLCPKPKLKATRGGAWKLVSARGSGFDIVHRKEHEQWCSQFCARHALYVKVQLNETAAWERVGIPDIDIELLGDVADTTGLLAHEKKEEESRLKAAEDATLLATERGDTGTSAPFLVTLRPKEVTEAPKDMGLLDAEDDEAHLKLEGYKPKANVSI